MLRVSTLFFLTVGLVSLSSAQDFDLEAALAECTACANTDGAPVCIMIVEGEGVQVPNMCYAECLGFPTVGPWFCEGGDGEGDGSDEGNGGDGDGGGSDEGNGGDGEGGGSDEGNGGDGEGGGSDEGNGGDGEGGGSDEGNGGDGEGGGSDEGNGGDGEGGGSDEGNGGDGGGSDEGTAEKVVVLTKAMAGTEKAAVPTKVTAVTKAMTPMEMA